MKIDGLKTFLIIWFGQLVSVIGSGLTHFALGVWVLKTTGSVTMFSLILLFSTLPAILFSPFAGVIVDRFDRRKVMIISDSIAGVGTLLIFALFKANNLEIWHLYIILSFSSIAGSLQFPAYQAAISTLVPKKHLGRASGMVQVAESIAIIISPILAGFLFQLIDLHGIVLIDFSTFLVAFLSLLFVRIPRVTSHDKVDHKKTSVFTEAINGWKYIIERPGLLWLLVFFAISNFLLGFYNILLQPYVLSFSNEKILGFVISSLGIGMLIGGLLMGAWGGPKQRIKGILGFGFLSGLALTLAGLKASAVMVAISIGIMSFFMPLTNGCSQVIWQSKVPHHIQGRVFALRRMIAMSLSPIAYILAGPLIDFVFEPSMKENGFLAGTLGHIFGVGEGRGMGVFITIIGICWAITAILLYLHPRVKNLEAELPDNQVVSQSDENTKSVQAR
ncbi:MFS transporter [Peribacillus alkalitolerans]|uniref:MFS transporter n=1 Tax=Peribacillus alkalitolerans TaxID=1550385 RepID=UPI0013D4C4C3|nr:MFS transporter [Peribacillus alkalitolerans]